MSIKVGDRVKALPNTVAMIWSDGRAGTVKEVVDPKPYSGNDSNNLVRWDGSEINLGFRHNEVTPEK